MNKGKVLRFFVKLVFIVGSFFLLVSALLQGNSALGGIKPGVCVVYGLLGSAYASVLVRRICQIPPPSVKLVIVQLAATVAGYGIGRMVGAFLFQLLLSAGTIAVVIALIVAVVMVVYSTAMLTILIPMAASGPLLDSEKEQLEKNLRYGCLPEEYQTQEGRKALEDILFRQGIM